MKTNYNSKIDVVRIGYYFDYVGIKDIDPANIKAFEPAQILNNIYSRLIEYDQNGSIQTGICSHFYFEKDYLVFEFDKKVKTQGGHYIDAEDAAVSIRRLLKLKTGTHSSIELILGMKHVQDDIFQNWDEIFTKEGKLYIQAKDFSHRPYLVASFATGDLAIVPKSSINPANLEITNHLETSGPYFLQKITKSANFEEWVLQKNSQHYNHLESTPTIVKLIDKKNPTAFKLLVDNEIDIIPSSINLYVNNLEEIKDIKGLNISKTLNIKLTYAQYSKDALVKFSREERNNVVQKIIKMYGEIPSKYLMERTPTFFQDQAFGKLTENEIKDIEALNLKSQALSLKDKITFRYLLFFKKKFDKYIHNEIPELGLVAVDNSNYKVDNTDLSISDTDTAFEESLPLIHYNFKMGTFGDVGGDQDKWLEDYMALETNELKAQKIHDLHLSALRDGVIFPMFKSPYTSIGRNGFVLPLSPIFASSYFWKIKKVD